MDAEAMLTAVAVATAVAGATAEDSPTAEKVCHRDGLGQLLAALTHDEIERAAVTLASFVVGISGSAGFPLEPLLDGLRSEALEQAR